MIRRGAERAMKRRNDSARNKKESEKVTRIFKKAKREARKCGVKAIVRLASQNPGKHPRATPAGIVIENVIGEVRVSTEMPHTPQKPSRQVCPRQQNRDFQKFCRQILEKPALLCRKARQSAENPTVHNGDYLRAFYKPAKRRKARQSAENPAVHHGDHLRAFHMPAKRRKARQSAEHPAVHHGDHLRAFHMPAKCRKARQSAEHPAIHHGDHLRAFHMLAKRRKARQSAEHPAVHHGDRLRAFHIPAKCRKTQSNASKRAI